MPHTITQQRLQRKSFNSKSWASTTRRLKWFSYVCGRVRSMIKKKNKEKSDPIKSFISSYTTGLFANPHIYLKYKKDTRARGRARARPVSPSHRTWPYLGSSFSFLYSFFLEVRPRVWWELIAKNNHIKANDCRKYSSIHSLQETHQNYLFFKHWSVCEVF